MKQERKQVTVSVCDLSVYEVEDVIRNYRCSGGWFVHQMSVTFAPHGKGYGVIVFERFVEVPDESIPVETLRQQHVERITKDSSVG